MGAGRRAKIMGALVAGEPATRSAEVVGITPKVGRTGSLVMLTMRHIIKDEHTTIAIEDVYAVNRERIVPGERNVLPRPVGPPGSAAWSTAFELSHALVFRYSAITWNADRLHNDADYACLEEGYLQAVQNGGLTLQLIIEAALPHLPDRLTCFAARPMRPLRVGDPLPVWGAAAGDGRMSCWGIDKDGYHCAAVELECAP